LKKITLTNNAQQMPTDDKREWFLVLPFISNRSMSNEIRDSKVETSPNDEIRSVPFAPGVAFSSDFKSRASFDFRPSGFEFGSFGSYDPVAL